MMPICGFRIFKFWKCQHIAEESVGEISTGGKDGYGKPWEQRHYLCKSHAHKLRQLLGLAE